VIFVAKGILMSNYSSLDANKNALMICADVAIT
jgi:hypothetical protein